MTKGLKIKGETIKFGKRSIGEIWYPCITKAFTIKYENVKMVVISPRLAIDDEMMIVTLIDAKKKFHQFSQFEFLDEAMVLLETEFGLKNIRTIEWPRFSWEEHENCITNKIIYPKELYWEDLFLQPNYFAQKMIPIMKFFFTRKSVSGRFNPKVLRWLKDQSQ